MNLAGLEADLYRRLGFQATPDPVVTTRLRAYINQTQREILSQKGLIALRRAVLSFSNVASLAEVALPAVAVRVVSVVDVTRAVYLNPITLDQIRELDPGDTALDSSPNSFAVINLSAATRRSPAVSGLSVASSSPSDGATKSVFLEGVLSGGEPVTASVALNGTTPVPLLTGVPLAVVTKFFVGLTAGGAATATGVVTLSDGAPVVISQIGAGRTYARYTVLRLYPTPSQANNYQAEVELHISDMQQANDEAYLPEDFSWLLTSGALLKEFQRLEKTALFANERATYRDGIEDLKVFVARATVPVGPKARPSAASATGGFTGAPGVAGPTGATEDAIALYDGVTGKLIKDSSKTISSLTQDVIGAVLPGGTLPTTALPSHHIKHEPGGSDALTLTAANRLFGRGNAGAGAVEEITLGDGLAMNGTVLSSTGGGGGPTGPHHTTHEPGGSDALTALSADILTSGTLADARLTSNVALRNAANTFTANQTVNGSLTVNGTLTATGIDGTPVPAANITGTVGTAQLPATIAYTNQANVFTQDQMISKLAPVWGSMDTSSAPNARRWQWVNAGSKVILTTNADDGALQTELLSIYRIGQLFFEGDIVAGRIEGTGLGNTPLNASKLTSGTVPDARLSANVLQYTGGYPGGTTTFLRADGTFAPFSGGGGDVYTYVANTFTENQIINKSVPRLKLWDTAQTAADTKKFEIASAGKDLYIQALNDAENVNLGYIAVGRTGNLTASGSLTVAGSGSGNPGNISGTFTGRLVIDSGQNYAGLEIKGKYTGGLHAGIILNEPAGGTNAKKYRINLFNGALAIERLSDAEDAVVNTALLCAANADVTVGGVFTAVGSIGTNTNTWRSNIHNSGGYMYPGNAASGAALQTSWWLGSHSSYGLYTNTGLYLESGAWCTSLEARAYVRSAGGLYDYARGTPIGVWTDGGTPSTGGTTVTGVYQNTYCLMGNTLFWVFGITTGAFSGVQDITISIPGGFTATGIYGGAIGHCQTNTLGQLPAIWHVSSTTYIYVRRANGGNWAGASGAIYGSITLRIG